MVACQRMHAVPSLARVHGAQCRSLPHRRAPATRPTQIILRVHVSGLSAWCPAMADELGDTEGKRGCDGMLHSRPQAPCMWGAGALESQTNQHRVCASPSHLLPAPKARASYRPMQTAASAPGIYADAAMSAPAPSSMSPQAHHAHPATLLCSVASQSFDLKQTKLLHRIWM